MRSSGAPVVEPGQHKDPEIWLLARPDEMPDRLLARATPMVLLRLSPQELEQVLGDATTRAGPGDRLRRLLASGAGRREVARDLQVSLRTVDRLIAAVRRDLGATTTAEAAARLRSQGW